MSYAFKITGLANKNELIEQAGQDYRLYKFSLNDAPDGFWVLLFQQVGREYREVTLSGNADSPELWATAAPSLSVKHVLRTAQRAVAQANVEANETDLRFNSAARAKAEAAEAAQAKLAAELEDLDFDNLSLDDPPIVPAEPDERTEPMMVAEGGPPLTPEEANSLFKMTPEGKAAASAPDDAPDDKPDDKSDDKPE